MRTAMLIGGLFLVAALCGCKYGGKFGVKVESPAFGAISVGTEANQPAK